MGLGCKRAQKKDGLLCMYVFAGLSMHRRVFVYPRDWAGKGTEREKQAKMKREKDTTSRVQDCCCHRGRFSPFPLFPLCKSTGKGECGSDGTGARRRRPRL